MDVSSKLAQVMMYLPAIFVTQTFGRTDLEDSKLENAFGTLAWLASLVKGETPGLKHHWVAETRVSLFILPLPTVCLDAPKVLSKKLAAFAVVAKATAVVATGTSDGQFGWKEAWMLLFSINEGNFMLFAGSELDSQSRSQSFFFLRTFHFPTHPATAGCLSKKYCCWLGKPAPRRSMYTLFTVMTMENWADLARYTGDKIKGAEIFFVFYIFCTSSLAWGFL